MKSRSFFLAAESRSDDLSIGSDIVCLSLITCKEGEMQDAPGFFANDCQDDALDHPKFRRNHLRLSYDVF